MYINFPAWQAPLLHEAAWRESVGVQYVSLLSTFDNGAHGFLFELEFENSYTAWPYPRIYLIVFFLLFCLLNSPSCQRRPRERWRKKTEFLMRIGNCNLVSARDKMICLLCDTAILTLKKFSAHQHYATHKDHKYLRLEGEVWKVALQKLKNEK
jgi:hypothetical protein